MAAPRPKIVGFESEPIPGTNLTHDYYVLECGHKVIVKHGVTRPRANPKRTPCRACASALWLKSLENNK